jgi:enoyl-CoA hydratase/carnithine racemase
MARAWEELPQITIAAIEGYAVGGGLALAVALDWRMMARDAFQLELAGTSPESRAAREQALKRRKT